MFRENYIIQGKIVCKTGLHIGGSSDAIDIGGSDNVVIRDSVTGNPFIPGSSLKGKLRFLTELNDKDSAQSVIDNDGKPADDPNCIASKLFGVSADESQNELKFPTRTIVRDSYPDEETLELWNNESLISGAELKYENTINRINSSANPRNIERIPKGSKFDFEIIFSVYEDDDENISYLLDAMRLLEDNYLGGSGSRGFGQIKFENIKLSKRTSDYYKENNDEEVIVESDDITEVINALK
ncbi:type III-A CRISPR-associated RAMP protein Csm3 [Methanobrevibacter thaueri]|uniref:CRISPR system Cms endoribonuclease Csm3 n=1 Tax=Methanobrevibacter thaueri TaxID=190975 RepID=A0A315XQT3_9EURY|nr:type III-A CRISPR-associated RAMP protein Csm3 [Methanobrevibacter thaueri]PWB88373.1 RAMP superfamily protein [Methanobrevibacter thaueri]